MRITKKAYRKRGGAADQVDYVQVIPHPPSFRTAVTVRLSTAEGEHEIHATEEDTLMLAQHLVEAITRRQRQRLERPVTESPDSVETPSRFHDY